jgi:hypothetical protein
MTHKQEPCAASKPDKRKRRYVTAKTTIAMAKSTSHGPTKAKIVTMANKAVVAKPENGSAKMITKAFDAQHQA